MFYHVADIFTLTQYYSIALITHGRILILFGEMQPGFRSVPPLHDAASWLKVWVVTVSVADTNVPLYIQMYHHAKFQESQKTLWRQGNEIIIKKNR